MKNSRVKKNVPFPTENVERTEKVINDTIDTVSKFEGAILKASMEGKTFIEVEKDVFDYYTKGHKTPYFVYGNKGIKVYVKGKREHQEEMDRLSVDDRLKLEAKGEL